MSQGVKIADSADLVRATAWARDVYAALRDWEFARAGSWSTWASGDLLLTIERDPAGQPCEPLRIAATNNRIAVHTRNWESDLPQEGQGFEDGVFALQDMVRRWFAGDLALAAFFLGENWQGSLMIDPRRLEQEIPIALRWIGTQTGVDRVEIQGPHPERDQRFGLAVNGEVLGKRPN
jgi:hypothetical protein